VRTRRTSKHSDADKVRILNHCGTVFVGACSTLLLAHVGCRVLFHAPT
jgi:hypothetical protein